VTELTSRLQRHLPELPAKQQAVARLLGADPTFVAFASVADIAARAGVDPATVVRTCQRIGYHGWSQLQGAVREELSGRPTFTERLDELGQSEGRHVGPVFATAIDNVASTLEDLDEAVLDEAASALARAEGILVAAGGVSEGPGLFLTSSLQLLGRRAHLVGGAAAAGPALSALRPGDVVVGLSVWRYLRTTVQTLGLAREAGATTIAVTDGPLAPAATVADHVLLVRTASVGPRLGLAGMVTLLEALIAQVAAVDPDAARAGAARADRLYFDGHVLADDPAGVARPD
jgi:RpiR family transcriptional regulator, carbohydrate utilization regulator